MTADYRYNQAGRYNLVPGRLEHASDLGGASLNKMLNTFATECADYGCAGQMVRGLGRGCLRFSRPSNIAPIVRCPIGTQGFPSAGDVNQRAESHLPLKPAGTGTAFHIVYLRMKVATFFRHMPRVPDGSVAIYGSRRSSRTQDPSRASQRPTADHHSGHLSLNSTGPVEQSPVKDF